MGELRDLERLVALEDIYTLKARRDRAADTKDWALYESLHAPDHKSYNEDYPPTETAAAMMATVRQAMAPLTTVHHSHTPEIDFESDTRASGLWAMKGLSLWTHGEESHWFLAFGHYFETYEKIAGRWKFTSRRLKYYRTHASPGAVFPPPLGSEHAAAARPDIKDDMTMTEMTEMTDLDRLVALDAIRHLKARRDRAVDTKDWDTYLALHAPDHQSHNDGFDQWNSAEEMITNVRRLLDETKVSVHHSHTPDIVFESPTRARGIWGMEDNIFWKEGEAEHWLQGFGFYHETYEKRGEDWLFTSRQLKRTHVHTSAGATPNAPIPAR